MHRIIDCGIYVTKLDCRTMRSAKEVERKVSSLFKVGKNEIGRLELMHKEKQISHAPEKRRLHSCILVGSAY